MPKKLDIKDASEIINLLRNYRLESLCYESFLNEKNKHKYDYEDVLFYLTNLALKYLEQDYSKSMFPKVLYSINAFLNRNDPETGKGMKITIETYLQLRKIKPAFDILISSNNKKYESTKKEIKENIDVLISDLEESLNYLSEQISDEISNEEDAKNTEDNQENKVSALQMMQDKINELREQIKEYETTIASYKKRNDKLTKNEEKLKSELQKLKLELNNIQNQSQSLEKHKIELEKKSIEIQKLTDTINNLNEQLQQIQTQFSSLSTEHEKIQTKFEAIKNVQDETNQKNKRRQEIHKIIIELLIDKNRHYSFLLKNINARGYDITVNELYQYINEIKSYVQINDKIWDNGNILCGLNKDIETDTSINFNSNSKEIDFVFISNSLLTETSDNYFYNLNKIYDYCARKNINKLFNLGNIFNLIDTYNYKNFSKLQKLIESIATNYPHDDNINSFFLGGNIDAKGLNMGINTIEQLCNQRLDFISLGYNSSTIQIEHTDSIRIYAADALKNLKNKSLVLTLYGDNQESVIDLALNYASMPPIVSDSLISGAIHVKAILDANGNVVETFLTPIIIKEKAIPTSLIKVYK